MTLGTNFYAVVQKVNFDGQVCVSQRGVDSEDTEAEWKLFRRLIRWLIVTKANLQQPSLTCQKLATILVVIPVTIATVECSFSRIKLIKTRLRKRMGEDTLESKSTMHICIEGPDSLDQ